MRKLAYTKDIICVRGGGDLATGVIQKLARAGMRVLVLEIAQPTAIRRTVALSTAIEKETMSVEDIVARFINFSKEKVEQCWQQGEIPIIIDPKGESILSMQPLAVIDAILAKKNLGTNKSLAPITIGLGPGFEASIDVDAVIETMRGHHLGRLILSGTALANTGIPGDIGGKTIERVLKAPRAGNMKQIAHITDYVEINDPLFEIDGAIVYAPFSGVLRGLLAEGLPVFAGMKVGDIDPRRLAKEECYEISDKARNLGGAVLEAFLYLKRVKEID